MKQSKICPKCSGRNILLIPGNADAYGVGSNIRVGAIHAAVKVHRYLCCDCGYSEEWIEKEDIPALKKKYQ